jgi:hypothetical protein
VESGRDLHDPPSLPPFYQFRGRRLGIFTGHAERVGNFLALCLSLSQSRSLHDRRQPIAISGDQPRQFPRAPKARHEELRLGERAEKPADEIFVGPIGDARLVAREKAERRADAVDSRPMIEPVEKISAKLVLDPSPNCDHDVPRAVLPNDLQQRFVCDGSSVLRRDVDVVFDRRDLHALHKGEQLFARGFCRHDPERRARLPNGFVFEQALYVLQPGNARDPFASKQSPEQHHEAAVGEREIGGEKCPTIIFVTAEVDHRGSGWRDEQPAVARDFIDCLARCPAEKPDAENRVDFHNDE